MEKEVAVLFTTEFLSVEDLPPQKKKTTLE